MKNFISFRLIFLSVLIFSCYLLSGQTVDTVWTRTLGGSGWNDQLSEVIATQDNNYIACGVLYDDFNQGDIWLVKFNDKGDIIWNKTYVTDTAQPWLNEGPRGLMEKENGEIVVFAGNSEWNHYILTIGTDGTLLAKIKYMNSGDPYYTYCVSVASSDGFLVAGDHAVAVGNDWVHYSWYRKIDAAGNLIWENSFPPVKWQDRFNCVHSLQGGGFVMAGTTDTENNYDDILLCLITDLGDSLWTKRWGTTAFDYPHDIRPVSGGGFIIGGTTSYMSSYDGLLLKLNSDGDELWRQSYNSYSDDEIHSVKQTQDEGFIITGQYKPDELSPSALWIMKADPLGNQVASFSLVDLGSGYGQCIIPSHDAGYVAVGKFESEGMIVKVTPNFGSFGIDEISKPAYELYPNPTQGIFNLQFTNYNLQSVRVEVVDLHGKVIESYNNRTIEQLNSGTMELDISHLPAGIYFVRISDSGSQIVKKIVKF